MINQEILDYIKNQSLLGKNREEIAGMLIAGGWKAEDVDQAFNSIASGIPAPVISGEMPSASAIFKEAWEIYKNHFNTLIAIAVIPAVAIFAFAFVFAGGALTASALKADMNSLTPVAIVVAVVAVLIAIYLSLWAQVAQLTAIRDHSENIGFKEAFKRSQTKIWAYLGTNILVFLSTIGGFILLIIPGILFAFWFSQSQYIVVEEGLAGKAALKKSKYYVKGRIGQVFAKGFFMGLVTFGIFIVVIAVVAGLNYLAGDYFSWLTNLFSVIWGPMATVYGYLVYKHLKTSRP